VVHDKAAAEQVEKNSSSDEDDDKEDNNIVITKIIRSKRGFLKPHKLNLQSEISTAMKEKTEVRQW
jgi:hypothetical protein